MMRTHLRMAFAWPVRVYWEDTDAGGIVFYANYLKFFERARTEWLRSLGVGQRALREQTGGMFVVLETQVRYLAPARLDDELIVTAAVHDAGRASLTIHQTARHSPSKALANAEQPGGTDRALCEGTIRIGWVNAASMRPTRIPPVILEKLKASE